MSETDKWQHQQMSMDNAGVDITHTFDETAENAYIFLSNATSVFEGALTARPGLIKGFSTTVDGKYIHSMRAYYDKLFMGADERVAYGVYGTSWSFISSLNATNNTGWTGSTSPISFIPWTAPGGQKVMYASDGTIMRKFELDGRSFGIGIPRPYSGGTVVDPGTGLPYSGDIISITPTTGGSLDSSGGPGYQWKYTYYSSTYMIESNPNDAVCTETTITGADTAAIIVVPNSRDAQVDQIMLYRRGGTLFDYYQCKVVDMASGTTTSITDTEADDDVAYNKILSEDNDQPFTTSDPLTGETVYGQPMKVLFGPYLGKYVFGIGDSLNPGHLYWCNPWSMDQASSFNMLEVSSDADPLMNGFVFQNKAYVISKNQVWAIYPSTTGGQTFVAVETNANIGIYFRYALAVGPRVWFVGHNGIYEFDGGTANNITDTSLIRPIFYSQETYDTSTQPPVDWTADEREVKLVWQDPYLYFIYWAPDYVNNQAMIMRYHAYIKRWEPWNTDLGGALPISTSYSDEGNIVSVAGFGRRLLFGARDGWVYHQGGSSDGGTIGTDGQAISVNISTAFFDQGLPREEKIYGDAIVEFNPKGTAIRVSPYINEDNINPMTQVWLPTSPNVRQRVVIPINPAGGTEGILGRSIAFNFFWSTAQEPPDLYELDVSFLPRPDIRRLRETDYTDAGYPKPKYVKGLIIEADTFGQDKTIYIQGDGVTYSTEVLTAVPGTIPNQAMRRVYQLSWPVFRAINLRIITQDTDPWQIYKLDWVYDQEPECFLDWDTNWLDLDWPYEKYVKGVSIEADTQGQDKTINLHIDGDGSTVVDSFVINHPGRTITMMKFNNVLARTIKLVSPEGNSCGYLYKVDWIWDREPPRISRWETQEHTLRSNAYMYLREVYVGLRSWDIICLDIWTDQGNGQWNTQLPRIFIDSTRGERQKPKVELPAVKGKNFKFLFTSQTPFKIYNSDCEVRVKEWNQDLGWKVYQLPFLGGSENP